jgi:uncharacterized membrane protein
MSSNKTDDAIAEYLREVEQRLDQLPMLQRRELLADLRSHIAAERIEQGPAAGEGQVLEILERLGSPAEVAAAAYAEAGTMPTIIRPIDVGTPKKPRMLLGAALAAFLIFVLLVVVACLGFSRGGSESIPEPIPAATQ